MNKVKHDAKLKEILDFVNRQVQESGYPPSVREICRAVGFKSTSTVHSYLNKLNNSGMIHKDPSKTRALKVLAGNAPDNLRKGSSYFASREMINVPIVGKVTAGLPILAIENIEDNFPLPADFVKDSDVFMLRIQGESMTGAGILDHDYVLVRQQSTASNGDIVVALIGDEATVKTFYMEKDHIRLQPENKLFDPIIVKDGFSILGKVTGVFRKLK